MMGGWVYIMTNRPFGTLYTGVTNNIARRVWEHKQGTGSIFTARYKLTRLVYMEWREEILAAINRETRLKHWPRIWKLNLIEQQNPLWEDLYQKLIDDRPPLPSAPPSWPGSSGPSVAAGACGGGPDEPGHDEKAITPHQA